YAPGAGAVERLPARNAMGRSIRERPRGIRAGSSVHLPPGFGVRWICPPAPGGRPAPVFGAHWPERGSIHHSTTDPPELGRTRKVRAGRRAFGRNSALAI